VLRLCSIVVLATGLLAGQDARPRTPSAPPVEPFTLSVADETLLEDLSRRSFRFFWDEADPTTGIVRDRARVDGSEMAASHKEIGSIASTGFGLTALCIAAERGWAPAQEIGARARATLHYFAERATHDRGWFYHWMNIRTGAREWKSELSSIDTALLVAGVVTARQCFAEDADIVRHATTIVDRIDYVWMLNGHPTLLSHGWRPESGWIRHRWEEYSEHMILYVLGLGSPTRPLPPESWAAWKRPLFTYGDYTYVHTVPPLFIHQYSQAWIDFRQFTDPVPPQADWHGNAIVATYAQRQALLDLAGEFPGYTKDLWGVTASDSRRGYKAWGAPPRDPDLDGSVVPAAAGGSLMLAPAITMPVMHALRARFGDRIYGKYGFTDAFHPANGWVNPDVIGIDVGITLLSAENLRSGAVWRWFMRDAVTRRGLARAAQAVRQVADAGRPALVRTRASAVQTSTPTGGQTFSERR
jgi:hypothetical protein